MEPYKHSQIINIIINHNITTKQTLCVFTLSRLTPLYEYMRSTRSAKPESRSLAVSDG